MTQTTMPEVTNEPLYPDVVVKLTGEDGNVFNLMAIVRRALRKDMHLQEELDEFIAEVQSSDSYDAALRVMMRWVTVV